MICSLLDDPGHSVGKFVLVMQDGPSKSCAFSRLKLDLAGAHEVFFAFVKWVFKVLPFVQKLADQSGANKGGAKRKYMIT